MADEVSKDLGKEETSLTEPSKGFGFSGWFKLIIVLALIVGAIYIFRNKEVVMGPVNAFFGKFG